MNPNIVNNNVNIKNNSYVIKPIHTNKKYITFKKPITVKTHNNVNINLNTTFKKPITVKTLNNVNIKPKNECNSNIQITQPNKTNKLKLSIHLMGGLCNQMFQLACAYVLSIKHNKDLVITSKDYNPHSEINYFTNIFRNINTDWNLNISNTYREITNTEHLYTDIPNFDSDTILYGYFQNYRYIDDYRNNILKLFKIEDDRDLRLKQLYPDINNSYFIHIRRGDYVNNSFHELNLDNYYLKALDTIRIIEKNKNYTIYVFSNDINYCKNLNWLLLPNIKFIENLDELDSLYLMSMCNKGGICCNSSYSWWGAYMIKNPNKNVIFPNKWFPDDTIITEIGWPGSILLSI